MDSMFDLKYIENTNRILVYVMQQFLLIACICLNIQFLIMVRLVNI